MIFFFLFFILVDYQTGLWEKIFSHWRLESIEKKSQFSLIRTLHSYMYIAPDKSLFSWRNKNINLFAAKKKVPYLELWHKTQLLIRCFFSIQKYFYFSYFSMKTYVMGTHKKRLAEALLMSTHNICFLGEIRKIFTGYPPLSRHMHSFKLKKDPNLELYELTRS